VACVGYDASGSLGNGPPLAEVHSFVETVGPVVAESLSTTYLVVCASLAAPGQVQCWGDDHVGQVGDGTTGVGRAVAGPSTVLQNPATSVALSDAYQVACEADACCAALGSGAVECWGNNANGELGDGTTVTRTGTVRVMGITTNVMKLVPASNRMFAVLTDNTVLVWGAGSSTPTGLAASDVMDVGAGRNHACLLSTSGRVTCTGENTSGECGTGVVTAMPVVAPVDVGLTGVTQISSSWSTTCAVTDIGELWCWGENGSGQTGVGDVGLADVPMPTLVTP
jgi:alpha-tubulin suppressor-like RCC1 family protein